MNKRDIFLAYAGHINIDIVLQVDHLTDDITNKVSSVEEQFGGTAGNFSMVASSLKIPFLIYSTVSGRSHGKYLEYMKGRGIDSSGITVTEDSFGPVCYAVNDGLKQKYYMAEGPMANALYKKLDDHYTYLHLSTGDPSSNLDLSERGNFEKLVFDPSQEVFYKYRMADMDKFLKKADFIMGNDNEIQHIFKTTGISMEDIVSTGTVIIETKGHSGTMIYGKKEIIVPSMVVDGKINTLGAGDSFRAGFYFGLYRNLSLVESVACGNVVAGMAVSSGVRNFQAEPENIVQKAKMLSHDIIS